MHFTSWVLLIIGYDNVCQLHDAISSAEPWLTNRSFDNKWRKVSEICYVSKCKQFPWIQCGRTHYTWLIAILQPKCVCNNTHMIWLAVNFYQSFFPTCQTLISYAKYFKVKKDSGGWKYKHQLNCNKNTPCLSYHIRWFGGVTCNSVSQH